MSAPAAPPRTFAAVDLGATSGRVILGTLVDGPDGPRFTLAETGRFTHPAPTGDDLRWDPDHLRRHVRAGLVEAERRSLAETGHGLRGIGIDTWGVDYGMLGADGALVSPPFHYRHARTAGVPHNVHSLVAPQDLYARCGLQTQPFNTLYQLVAETGRDWPAVDRLLLMPDLLTHWLTGRAVAEVTNASTTGLLDVTRRTWSAATLGDLEQRWGVPAARILPPLVEPGTVVGVVRDDVLATDAAVVAVASHDTASAIVSVPATDDDIAFISSGTWSLVGLELPAPVLTEESRRANFTNELGLDGTVRYLKNVMGLWVLTESLRTWRGQGLDLDLIGLLDEAAELPALRTVVDIDDQSLLSPGDLPARIAALAASRGEPVPATPGETVRCILDSLALAYRGAVRTACRLAGRQARTVHVVGGGSNNRLLCQLTAEATGRSVVAGPDEGTALGNLLVQARATGHLGGDLADLRRVARASATLTTYSPGALGIADDAWEHAARRAGVHDLPTTRS